MAPLAGAEKSCERVQELANTPGMNGFDASLRGIGVAYTYALFANYREWDFCEHMNGRGKIQLNTALKCASNSANFDVFRSF